MTWVWLTCQFCLFERTTLAWQVMGEKGLGGVEVQTLPIKEAWPPAPGCCVQAERGETQKQRLDFSFLNLEVQLGCSPQGKSPSYAMCSLIIDNRGDQNHERVPSWKDITINSHQPNLAFFSPENCDVLLTCHEYQMVLWEAKGGSGARMKWVLSITSCSFPL